MSARGQLAETLAADGAPGVDIAPANMARPPINADGVRLLVMLRLRSLDLSLNEASRRIGKNPTYLYKFLQLGVPCQLPDPVRQELARLLKVKPEDLLHKTEDNIAERTGSHKMRPGLQFQGGWDGPKDLPILAVQSLYGAMIKPESEYTERPPYLGGVRGAFGVRMPDASLRLRYKPGDILFFHPGVIPAPGDGVFVELTDGQRRIGILERLRPDGVDVRHTTETQALDCYSSEQIKRLACEVGTKRVANL
jgi:hypothetical protein